ncbi:hypothetical protein SAMN05216285_0342 [Natrinema salifodinae]|uniref:Uncharacterized protein n=2 Tax=Natrinema salifodinae TaxID=1202768 RepID=A0A1I0M248_9EURY|nr:hypothetical protein SAMN05216285_0342 [Natrinema salifodinae]
MSLLLYDTVIRRPMIPTTSPIRFAGQYLAGERLVASDAAPADGSGAGLGVRGLRGRNPRRSSYPSWPGAVGIGSVRAA